jgi:hypothetical protein
VQIITRSAWGARHPNGFGPAPVPWRDWYLHHSVTVAPDLVPPYDDEHRAMRQLELIGQQRFGGGVSYTYAVMPSGRIYQGHSKDRRGAHTKDHNTTARGIVLVGDYTERDPTPAQLDAVAALVAHAYRAGWCTRPSLTGGHRDVKQTGCPGDRAYAAIPNINRRAAALLHPEEDTLDSTERKALAAEVASTTARAVREAVLAARDADDQILLADWVAEAVGKSSGATMSSHELAQQAMARCARLETKLDTALAALAELRDR